MMRFGQQSEKAKLVAVCDSWEEGLRRKKEELQDDSIGYYTSFEKFLEHGLDAVVLANYATEHAPFAIACLERGIHVLSEVLPVQNMKEAVELIEAAEKSKAIYA